MIYDHPFIGWTYRKSPLVLQNALVSVYGLLQRWEGWSPEFVRLVEELENTERWSAGELEALQAQRLQTLIRHAYENVPYYRRVFDERRMVPSDIRVPADLYKVPILTKQDVRRFGSQLRARNVPRRRTWIGRTGGTTGVPLVLSLDKQRILFDHALIHRHWSWAGYRPGDRTVFLRGFTLIPPETHQATYWRFDRIQNRIYLSGFHLSADVLPLYVQKLQQWKPHFIAGYPSSVFTLARFMEHEKTKIPMKAIFTSSEALTEVERRVIEERFACRVWDRYGTGERLAVTQQCEYGNYHQNSEFGVFQVDLPLGEPAPTKQKGALILTGLTNFSMPLIRYAIEDIGSVDVGNCLCGRQLPLSGPVEGRKDDMIVTIERRLMPRAGLDQIHEFVQNIERCQLVQKRIGEVIVRVQPRQAFNQADSAELIRQLRKRLGADTSVKLELVEKLELTPTGKQRFIVSEVDINALTGLELEVRANKNPCEVT